MTFKEKLQRLAEKAASTQPVEKILCTACMVQVPESETDNTGKCRDCTRKPRASDDDNDGEYMRLVKRDIHTKATEEEQKALRGSQVAVLKWKDTLTDILRGCDVKIARINAEMGAAEQDSRNQNTQAARDAFFRYRAAKETERANTAGFKNHTITRLKLAKSLLRDAEASKPKDHFRDEVIERLDRIEKKLDEDANALDLLSKLAEKIWQKVRT